MVKHYTGKRKKRKRKRKAFLTTRVVRYTDDSFSTLLASITLKL